MPNSHFQRLKNLLITNQKERLNFNLGTIQATVIGDEIEFNSNQPFLISIQIIKNCDHFRKTKYCDMDDFENTAGIGSNRARQAFYASVNDMVDEAYITNEFLGDFVIEFELIDIKTDEIDRVFGKLLQIKKYYNFKF